MKKLLKQFGIYLVSCTLVLQLAGPTAALAQNGNGEPASPAPSPPPAPVSLDVGFYLKAEGQNQSSNIAAFIIRFVNFLAGIIGSFAFLAIVVGGVIMVTSGGQEGAVTKGKDIIKYAIIGLIVAVSAYFITTFVQSIFFEYGTS